MITVSVPLMSLFHVFFGINFFEVITLNMSYVYLFVFYSHTTENCFPIPSIGS